MEKRVKGVKSQEVKETVRRGEIYSNEEGLKFEIEERANEWLPCRSGNIRVENRGHDGKKC